MTYYCGIDLHSTNSVIVVTDEGDRVVFKMRLPNELRLIIKVFQQREGHLRQTKWLFGCQPQLHRIQMIN